MASRGKNFTEREKCKLLELIQKYKNVIENKATNAVSINNKNEAWAGLTMEFNSTAEIPRTQKQLHTAFLNLKRVTRQNVATENKGVMTTGGGTYQRVLSSIGAQMLAVMGDQVTPLSNNCDSASSYYKNDEDVMTSDVLANQDIITSDNNPQPTSQPKNKPIIQRQKQITNKNNDSLKTQYYLKKMKCAVLEKKIKLMEYKMTIKKEKILDLELKMKEKEYENMLNK